MEGSPFHRLVTRAWRWLRSRRVRKSRARFVLIDGERSWLPRGSNP